MWVVAGHCVYFVLDFDFEDLDILEQAASSSVVVEVAWHIHTQIPLEEVGQQEGSMGQVAILVQEHHIHSARSVVLGMAKIAVFAFGCSFQPVAEVFADSVVVLQPAAASRILEGWKVLPAHRRRIDHSLCRMFVV